jgi:hypothetical protein
LTKFKILSHDILDLIDIPLFKECLHPFPQLSEEDCLHSLWISVISSAQSAWAGACPRYRVELFTDSKGSEIFKSLMTTSSYIKDSKTFYEYIERDTRNYLEAVGWVDLSPKMRLALDDGKVLVEHIERTPSREKRTQE